MKRFTKREALIHLRGLVHWHDTEVDAVCPYCKQSLGILKRLVEAEEKRHPKKKEKDDER